MHNNFKNTEKSETTLPLLLLSPVQSAEGERTCVCVLYALYSFFK